jgi:alkyl sulfatase BDS1-like metallo-beta-lactamase superfamily hydrolase
VRGAHVEFADEKLTIDDMLTDTSTRNRLWLSNAALVYSFAPQKGEADITLTTTRRSLPALATGALTADGLAEAGIELDGDGAVLGRLAALLSPGDKDFSIVTP